MYTHISTYFPRILMIQRGADCISVGDCIGIALTAATTAYEILAQHKRSSGSSGGSTVSRSGY